MAQAKQSSDNASDVATEIATEIAPEVASDVASEIASAPASSEVPSAAEKKRASKRDRSKRDTTIVATPDAASRRGKKGAKRLRLAHAALARFQKEGEQGKGEQGKGEKGKGDGGFALPLAEAVAALCATPRAKFDETLEVAMNLGIDPRHADQQVRGTISLPHGTGKKLRVAVFARDEKAEQARKAGADIVGAEDLAERIQKGELPFDRCIATPDMMGLVGRLGKILGPRNLMPNPKLGTVAANVIAAVEAAKGGEVQFRAEKNGVVHAGIGRMSFSESQLRDNVLAFAKAVIALKPEGAKGSYVQKITLSTTMGLGVGVDIRSVASA